MISLKYNTVNNFKQIDSYLGGMGMPERSYNVGNYAYGFNGKRMDNELHSEGNTYDFEARIYDPSAVLNSSAISNLNMNGIASSPMQ